MPDRRPDGPGRVTTGRAAALCGRLALKQVHEPRQGLLPALGIGLAALLAAPLPLQVIRGQFADEAARFAADGVAEQAPDPLKLLEDAGEGGDFLDDLLGKETLAGKPVEGSSLQPNVASNPA